MKSTLLKYLAIATIALMAVGCGTSKKSSGTASYTTDSIATQQPAKELKISSPQTQLAGEWSIVAIDGKNVKTTEHPFITLDFAEMRFYGNNGCNVINGTMECEGASLRFGNIISTMKSCDSETSEHVIMKALNDTRSVRLQQKNGIDHLALLNSRGHTVATLKKQNMTFLNGAWTVTEIAGTAMESDMVKLVIDIDQLTLHGNSGCNIVNGTVYIDYEKDWGIQFQQLISTRKMCEDMKIETALLIALESTEIARPDGPDTIALYDGNGECLARFKRLNLERR